MGWFLVFLLILIVYRAYHREQDPPGQHGTWMVGGRTWTFGRIRKPALFLLIETILMGIGVWFAARFAEDEFCALGSVGLCFGGMLLVEGFFREPSQSESATAGVPAPPATNGLDRIAGDAPDNC